MTNYMIQTPGLFIWSEGVSGQISYVGTFGRYAVHVVTKLCLGV